MTRTDAIRAIALPLLVLCLFLAFSFFYNLLGLPSSTELIHLSESYFRRYGYFVVFIGAFLEATPVANFYLPGSAIIILAVAFSRDGTLNPVAVVATASVAFLLAYVMNWFSGVHGWYRLLLKFGLAGPLEKTRNGVMQHGSNKWLWLSYIHPNFGALTAIVFGTLRVPFSSFFINSLGAIIFWNSIWGFVAYYGSEQILQFLDMRWLIPFVIVWAIAAVVKNLRKKGASNKIKESV